MTTTDIFCGSAGRSLAVGDTRTRVILTGPGANAKLNLEHICKPLLTSMPRKFHDLIEVASYVYVADQLTDRQGRRDGSDHGRLWRRKSHAYAGPRLLTASEADATYRLRHGSARKAWQQGRVRGKERPGRGRAGRVLILHGDDCEHLWGAT